MDIKELNKEKERLEKLLEKERGEHEVRKEIEEIKKQIRELRPEKADKKEKIVALADVITKGFGKFANYAKDLDTEGIFGEDEDNGGNKNENRKRKSRSKKKAR